MTPTFGEIRSITKYFFAMKLTLIQKIELVLLLLAASILFLAIKEAIPYYSYLITGSILGIYFFPVRLVLQAGKEDADLQPWIGFVISSLVVSMILGLSIIAMYLQKQGLFRNVLGIVGIINSLLLFFYLKERKTLRISALHLCAGLTASVAFFV